MSWTVAVHHRFLFMRAGYRIRKAISSHILHYSVARRCSTGARVNCVRSRYRPGIDGEEDIYSACTRMVRVDYCGQRESTTNTGTLIDKFDDRNIQVPDNLPDQAFEAGWTAAGAVCVAHVRVKGNTSLDRLAASCPQLAGKLGDACTTETARAAGAMLFNRSRP